MFQIGDELLDPGPSMMYSEQDVFRTRLVLFSGSSLLHLHPVPHRRTDEVHTEQEDRDRPPLGDPVHVEEVVAVEEDDEGDYGEKDPEHQPALTFRG